MNIVQLIVRIGDHEESLANCIDENPDVAELMRMATSFSAVITIEVPQIPEAAAALGRIVFCRPKAERTRSISSTDRISTLSKRIDEVGLLPRTVTALQSADHVYVWQVAEKMENEIAKLKNVGRKALNDVKVTFREKGIELGADLSSIKDQLPRRRPQIV